MFKSGSRDIYKPGFGHCSRINIELREKQVRCNRELHMINKNLEGMQRQHVRNMRKFDSAQRGVMLLIGESPYPDCTREDAIFLHNQPGFCFRRNGKPRSFASLQESKSRKIVSDMDGNEGLRPNPALNVVSDTPTLTEILSSPELVQILCELRNTAALMTNEQLFNAFADQLGKTHRKFPFFKEFQGPLDYLKQYRKNLIQEFFDTLKTEAEMRLFVVPVDPVATFFQLTGMAPPSSSGETKSSTASRDDDKNGGNSAANSNLTSRGTTRQGEDDSSKSYEPDLANRIVDKVKSATKLPVHQPAWPHQRPDTTTKASPKSSSQAINDEKARDAQLDATSSIHDSVSKNDIFATTDFIPTSQGYMTVEDWNVAVLEQLKRAQEEEEKKREEKKKAHNKKSQVSSAENNEQDHYHHHGEQEQEGHIPREDHPSNKHPFDFGDQSASNNGNNNKEQEDNNNNEEDDNATEELRRKVAAAVAAEEEARYRLDQKIMGLAGITSLYKSSNIGFSKYFEHKDELREKELKSRENPNHKKAKTSSRGGNAAVTGWLAPVHHRFSKDTGEGNNALAINSDGRKIAVTKFPSSTNTLTDSSSVGTKDASVASSKKRIFLSKKKMKKALNSTRTKAYQRQEFDTFVRGLISNIEEISAVGKQVSGLSKRRPVALQRLINPLVRLLKRDSLFDTLNDEDVFFSEFEGGKKELERIVAAQIPTGKKRPKSRGFGIKLPSRTSMPAAASTGGVDGQSDLKIPPSSALSEEIPHYHSKSTSEYSSSPPYSARSNKPSSATSSGIGQPYFVGAGGYHHHEHKHRYLYQDSSGYPGGKSQVDSKETCWICPPRSLQRVCCAACRAKTQQACSSVLRRDKNCKVTMSMNSWKIPGMHPSNWKKKEHLAETARMNTPYSKKMANTIPAKLRKFYESSYPLPTDDERSRSLFLEPPTDVLDMPPQQKHAAPTPVYLKKRLYPLPAVLTNVPLAMAATALNPTTSVAGPHRSSTSSGFSKSRRLDGDSVMYNLHAPSSLPPPGAAASQASSSVRTIAASGRKGYVFGTRGSAGVFPRLGLEKGITQNANYQNLSKGSTRAKTAVLLSPYEIEQDPHPTNMGGSFLASKGSTYYTHPPRSSNDNNNDFESWTLKVSKFDILKLRHELDGESVKEKVKQFEAQYLRHRPNST